MAKAHPAKAPKQTRHRKKPDRKDYAGFHPYEVDMRKYLERDRPDVENRTEGEK